MTQFTTIHVSGEVLPGRQFDISCCKSQI